MAAGASWIWLGSTGGCDAAWVKVAIDAWASAAGVADGRVFRSVDWADVAQGEALSEKVVWQLLKPYAEAAGVPGIAPMILRLLCRMRHRRRTCEDMYVADEAWSQARLLNLHDHPGQGIHAERLQKVLTKKLVGKEVTRRHFLPIVVIDLNDLPVHAGLPAGQKLPDFLVQEFRIGGIACSASRVSPQ
jgi:hypothetical protein